MLLNSYYFIFFFFAVFFLYWKAAKNARQQNIVLLIANGAFYASWSLEFLLLLAFTTASSFVIGKKIFFATGKVRQRWTTFGIVLVIGFLAYFKYCNFFIENINDFLNLFGIKDKFRLLSLLFPLGISFYSFRIIGYLMDIRNKKIKELPDFLNYAVFISFFPTIISGPIDKPGKFLAQIKPVRLFQSSMFADGLRQIHWGLFKKLVVGDNIATITAPLFAEHQDVNGMALLIGAMLFLIQLYADFSGYSDMAIGISRLLGIEVQPNFNYPLFAMNIADFWRKWHISLTSWLTEYVFTPLSIRFRDYYKWGLILAIIINFVIIGFWHGAAWKYLLFGLVNGMLYIPLILKGKLNKKVKDDGRFVPKWKEAVAISGTFLMMSLVMILFSAENLSVAIEIYRKIFSASLFSLPDFKFQKEVAFLILLMFLIEWANRSEGYALQNMFAGRSRIIRWGLYYILLFLISLYYLAPKGYIYAQF